MAIKTPFFRFDDKVSPHIIHNAIDSVIKSNRFVLSDQVNGFEEEFAAYCGVDHCVGLGNGTDAL